MAPFVYVLGILGVLVAAASIGFFFGLLAYAVIRAFGQPEERARPICLVVTIATGSIVLLLASYALFILPQSSDGPPPPPTQPVQTTTASQATPTLRPPEPHVYMPFPGPGGLCGAETVVSPMLELLDTATILDPAAAISYSLDLALRIGWVSHKPHADWSANYAPVEFPSGDKGALIALGIWPHYGYQSALRRVGPLSKLAGTRPGLSFAVWPLCPWCPL